MRLFIINGEKLDDEERIECDISENSTMRDIRNELDHFLKGNGMFIKDYLRFIYKNVILIGDNYIRNYKICEKDEIWFGRIENYLRKDYIIVYAFVVGEIRGYEYLIVKMNDTISTIRSIIERIYSQIVNIWNADGKQMRNDQIVTEIDTNENYELIIECDDGEGNEINNTFEYCCDMRDKRCVDRYLFADQIRDDNKNESTRTTLINFIDQIKQVISVNYTIDVRLNQNLSDFPASFHNSLILFCNDMTDRILDIYNDYCRPAINQCENDALRIFNQYFHVAIRSAVWDYSNLKQPTKIQTRKSMRDIIIDALDYFMKYLIDSRNDWRYWLRLYIKQFVWLSLSDSAVDERIRKSATFKFSIKVKTTEIRKHFNTFIPKTVKEAKKSVSKVFKVDMKHLYCIKPGGDLKPNDQDKFDDEFIIEIVLSMADIEILKYLDKGGYGEVFLCEDKISGHKFALKKQLGAQRDLYRDISIQCRIRNCGNIMNYLGLYKMDGNICIAMQYMSEGSIKSCLDKGKSFSENDLIKICYQILLQIRDIHKEGIIHRDIRCDNIVINKYNTAKLIDFGSSKFTDDLSNKKLPENFKSYKPGAVRFMAPEILKCEKYTNKIDIWSFGAAMIEMITGKYPYYYLNDLQAMLKIRITGKIEFEPTESISQQFIELINLCLNRDPDERPSAEQLIQINIFNLVKSGS